MNNDDKKLHLQLPKPTTHQIPEADDGDDDTSLDDLIYAGLMTIAGSVEEVATEDEEREEIPRLAFPVVVELEADFDPRRRRNNARFSVGSCDVFDMVGGKERQVGAVRATVDSGLQIADYGTGFTMYLSPALLWNVWEVERVRFLAEQGFDYDAEAPFGQQWKHDGKIREPLPEKRYLDFEIKEIRDGVFINGAAVVAIADEQAVVSLRPTTFDRHKTLVIKSMVGALENAYAIAEVGEMPLVDAMRKACGLAPIIDPDEHVE